MILQRRGVGWYKQARSPASGASYTRPLSPAWDPQKDNHIPTISDVNTGNSNPPVEDTNCRSRPFIDISGNEQSPRSHHTMALSPVLQEHDAQQDLLQALSALKVTGRFSDLRLVCNARHWDVHKAIVCSRSGFFDGACSHQFREATSGVIDLSEDDEDAVEQMVHYFYYLDYLNDEAGQQPASMFRHRAYSDQRARAAKKLDLSQIEDPLLAQAGFYRAPQTPATPPGSSHGERSSLDMPDKKPRSPVRARAGTPPLEVDEGSEEEYDEEEYESTETESHLLLHTRVYALAEKYDIPSLKQLARRKFEMAVACYYDAPELADAIEFVYSSTIDSDRGLRDVVIQLFRTHPQLANTQDMFAVIQETPTLALDLWKVERGLL